MSKQNKAPRWEDVPATDYDAEARAWVVGYLTSLRDDEVAEVAVRRAAPSGTYVEATWRMHEANLRWLDAALARLAEPAQSSAAERWRAVPAEQRGEVLAWLSGAREAFVEEHAEASVDDVRECRDRLRAIDALLALAREAEGGGG